MANMKIENYSGTVNTFTWPNNPQTFDDDIVANYTKTLIDYQRYNILVSGGGVNPKQIILTGQFNGTNKNDDYQTLSGHFMENYKLKKLYFESDKFYLGVGRQSKKTHSGGRTNFVDYVATFETIIGILFSDTQKTHTDGGAEQTNDGNLKTFIEEISGTYDGSGNVVIEDSDGNAITISSSKFSGTEDFIYRFVYMIDTKGDNIYVTEYAWTGIEVDSGTTTSEATNKLIQTGQNFLTTVSVGDLVKNTTDDTISQVKKIDSDTQLTLIDDIMDSGEDFVIFHGVSNSAQNSIPEVSQSTIIKLISGNDTSDISVSNLAAGYKIKFRDAYSS